MQVISVELDPTMFRVHFINNKGVHTCIDQSTCRYITSAILRRKLFVQADEFFIKLQQLGFPLEQVFDKCPDLLESDLEYLKLKWL